MAYLISGSLSRAWNRHSACFHLKTDVRDSLGGMVRVLDLLRRFSGNTAGGCKSLGSIGINAAAHEDSPVSITAKDQRNGTHHLTDSVAHSLFSSGLTIVCVST